MNPLLESGLQINRRHFFSRSSTGIGAIALASLLNGESTAAGGTTKQKTAAGGLPGFPNFPPPEEGDTLVVQRLVTS